MLARNSHIRLSPWHVSVSRRLGARKTTLRFNKQKIHNPHLAPHSLTVIWSSHTQLCNLNLKIKLLLIPVRHNCRQKLKLKWPSLLKLKTCTFHNPDTLYFPRTLDYPSIQYKHFHIFFNTHASYSNDLPLI